MSVAPDNYRDYYAKKLEQAREFQDYVFTVFYYHGLTFVSFESRAYQNKYGENSAGIEIKYDDRLAETGNLYIETEEKSHPGNPRFVPSGIYRDDNAWLYVIGNHASIYVFGKKQLQELHKEQLYREVAIATSKGFLIPRAGGEGLALKVFRGQPEWGPVL